MHVQHLFPYPFPPYSLTPLSLSLALSPSIQVLHPPSVLQRQHTPPQETKKGKTHIRDQTLTVIRSHHVPLQGEPQHHDFPGDSAGCSGGAVLRLVRPAQSLQHCPLQRQSSRSAAVVMAIRLVLPWSGVQSAPICLLPYGACLARVDQTAEIWSTGAPNGCEGSITECFPVRHLSDGGLPSGAPQCFLLVYVESQSSTVLTASLSSHTTQPLQQPDSLFANM